MLFVQKRQRRRQQKRIPSSTIEQTRRDCWLAFVGFVNYYFVSVCAYVCAPGLCLFVWKSSCLKYRLFKIVVALAISFRFRICCADRHSSSSSSYQQQPQQQMEYASCMANTFTQHNTQWYAEASTYAVITSVLRQQHSSRCCSSDSHRKEKIEIQYICNKTKSRRRRRRKIIEKKIRWDARRTNRRKLNFRKRPSVLCWTCVSSGLLHLVRESSASLIADQNQRHTHTFTRTRTSRCSVALPPLPSCHPVHVLVFAFNTHASLKKQSSLCVWIEDISLRLVFLSLPCCLSFTSFVVRLHTATTTQTHTQATNERCAPKRPSYPFVVGVCVSACTSEWVWHKYRYRRSACEWVYRVYVRRTRFFSLKSKRFGVLRTKARETQHHQRCCGRILVQLKLPVVCTHEDF